MKYITETLKFIESEEMREHLLANPKLLDRNTCAQIVAHAPASVVRKLATLELIADETEPDGDFGDPAKLANEIRIALDERYNNPPGTVFQLFECSRHIDARDYTLFITFDAMMKHIRENKKLYVHSGADYTWYEIEKWIPGNNDKMELYFKWVLNTGGEIWFFEYCDTKFKPENWYNTYGYSDFGINHLTIPFEAGDIITTDWHPFAESRQMLILENCRYVAPCASRCLYITADGKFDTDEFYYDSFRYSSYSREGTPKFPAFYKVSRRNIKRQSVKQSFAGKLFKKSKTKPEETEIPLVILSKAIKSNSELGAEIWNFYHSMRRSGKTYQECLLDWDVLRDKFVG